jgi:hypothetical protein
MPAVLVKNVHVSLIRNSRFVGKNSLAAAGERLVFFSSLQWDFLCGHPAMFQYSGFYCSNIRAN